YPTMAEFYAGKTVAITGGTGFLGQGITEKLLRTCPDISKIILFIRTKRNTDPKERLKQLAMKPAFDILRQSQPNFHEKLSFVSCDLEADDLGLSSDDRRTLRNEVNIFIHSAATLKFNEHLRISYEMNVLCVRRLLKLKWNNLQAFVHVSTAYAHVDRKYMKEEFYDCGIDYLDLEATLKWLGDDAIEKLTPDLLKTRPNTYTLTKALAEDVICRESGNLPTCIVRPSMIIPAWQEPMPGWCTNVYGPTAFIIAYGKGLLRCCLADREINADLIPVDFVVNGVIEIMSSETARKSTNIQIYHINSSTTNPLNIDKLSKYLVAYCQRLPCRKPTFLSTSCFTHEYCLQHLGCFTHEHMILQSHCYHPTSQPPRFVKLNGKIQSGMEVMGFFFTTNFQWDRSNADRLLQAFQPGDRKMYNLDVRVFTWKDYFMTYISGAKKFILKEE
uniref:Fatty acyl-CoA reductase n=1 Tax=Ciona savignyi TaxID=51511 RepID=H2YBG4_CIOSA